MRRVRSRFIFLCFLCFLLCLACSEKAVQDNTASADPSPTAVLTQETASAVPSPAVTETPLPLLIGGQAYTGKETELKAVLAEDDFPVLELFDALERVDCSGSVCYEQIQAYQLSHPDTEIIYTVSVDNRMIPWDTESLALEELHKDEVPLLVWLPQLRSLSVETPLQPAEASALIKTLPDATLDYRIAFSGTEADSKAAYLDLSGIEKDAVPEAIEAVASLPGVISVELDRPDGSSPWTFDQAKALIQLRPDIEVHYTTTAFGVTFSLTDPVVSFNKIDLHKHVAELWELLPALAHVGRLDMENCGIPDEQMAELREAFPSPKIVWRINVHGYTCRTDAIMIRFSDNTMGRRIYDSYTKPFIYCNEVKYLDLGHNAFTDAYFTAYMPDLEVCILAVGEITDISALANCPKLEYLEIFTGHVTDISVLASCKNLKHLNMCRNDISDISPLFELNLERLYLSKNPIPSSQIEEFRMRFPDCEVNNVVDNPTAGAWRVISRDSRYAILRKQLSYDHPGISSYSEVPDILKWW